MRKGRYGKYVRSAITIIDLILLNILYVVVFSVMNDIPQMFTPRIWGAANISYLIASFLFSENHNRRVMFADKIVVDAAKTTILYAAILFSALWLCDVPDFKSRIVILFLCIFFVFLSLWWILSRKLIKLYRASGFNYKRTIIIGNGEIGHKLIDEMNHDPGYGFKILGVFDTEIRDLTTPYYMGKIEEVEKFVKEHNIDEMYCTLVNSGDNLEKLIDIAESNAIDFYYVPQVGTKIIRRFELNSIGDIPTLTVRPNPLSRPINRLIKRSFDVVFSTTFLLISPVIFIPVAVAIKFSSKGPIFFKQLRTGYRGNSFTCYKFRTMKVNGDSDKVQATQNDPRKTMLGNVLRKLSIDELPQFFNVLKGEMSVVGPRPHMLKHTQDYSILIKKYMLRHTVKPGITGWAQINGFRGETKELWQMQKRVEYDVWYTENWNLWLDIKIIFRTVTNALAGEKNAC